MERAAAGETFAVTRRGRPYFRLGPAIEPLPLAAPDEEPNGDRELAQVKELPAAGTRRVSRL